jgi:hypothetical protein
MAALAERWRKAARARNAHFMVLIVLSWQMTATRGDDAERLARPCRHQDVAREARPVADSGGSIFWRQQVAAQGL